MYERQGHKKFTEMVVIVIMVFFGFFYSFGSVKHSYFFVAFGVMSLIFTLPELCLIEQLRFSKQVYRCCHSAENIKFIKRNFNYILSLIYLYSNNGKVSFQCLEPS